MCTTFRIQCETIITFPIPELSTRLIWTWLLGYSTRPSDPLGVNCLSLHGHDHIFIFGKDFSLSILNSRTHFAHPCDRGQRDDSLQIIPHLLTQKQTKVE